MESCPCCAPIVYSLPGATVHPEPDHKFPSVSGGLTLQLSGRIMGELGWKVRPEDLEDLASQAREVESGWTAGSVNLSRIQRHSEAAALQSEVCV